MYLFFDTETTGLPLNWKAPVTNTSNWPRLVQLAWLHYDANGALLSVGNYIVRPNGFTISPDAARIHGITTDIALAKGEILSDVLDGFKKVLHISTMLVAHNMSFDEKIMGAEFLRNNQPNYLDGKRKICTMESSTSFCALPGPYGYKWPKLEELHHKLFKTTFAEAHNAAVDIGVTAKCFWELKRMGII
jgi:DNA polymerase III epsilon subunit-like protein